MTQIPPGFRLIDHGVMSRLDPETLRERLLLTDLVVSDLDECVYPFITQADVGLRIFADILRDAGRPEKLEPALRMSWFAGYITFLRVWQRIIKRRDNSVLIPEFEKMMRGVPRESFRKITRELADRHVPGAPEVLGRFRARGVPVGFISLGLDTIIDTLIEGLRELYGLDMTFRECTVMLYDSDDRFSGFDPKETWLRGPAKKTLIERRIAQTQSKHPLAIGHDVDDRFMLDTARRRGGLSIGIRPEKQCHHHIDLIVPERDWRPLDALLADLMN